ncbi:MAG TPA: DUF1987 domain-containing protein [Cytophaga sp.]|jgi:hypothetical protein|nr:DUF1987 domain-containing protein [Cytophaga sp.]
MADEIRIPATEDTPEVLLEDKSGVFKISGRSLPEDAFWFYNPIMEWLGNYSKTPLEVTVFHFNLEYFNTASAKQIFKIANLLSAISKGNKVVVKWHYDEGDKDMYASGERFSKLCGMPFELIKN